MNLINFIKMAAKAGLSAGGSISWGSLAALLNANGYQKNTASGVVGLDADNQVHANVIPRTGSLASLQALVGGTGGVGVGEVAVATDKKAMVVVSGGGTFTVYESASIFKAADIENAVIGTFTGNISYIYPLGGAGTPYASIQVLYSFLEQCLFAPSSYISIYLGPGTYGDINAGYELPNVSFYGTTGTVDLAGLGVVTGHTGIAGNYSVTMDGTGLVCPAGTWLGIDNDQGSSNADSLTLCGVHLVTASSATSITFNVKGRVFPPNGTIVPNSPKVCETVISSITLGEKAISAKFQDIHFLNASLSAGCTMRGNSFSYASIEKGNLYPFNIGYSIYINALDSNSGFLIDNVAGSGSLNLRQTGILPPGSVIKVGNLTLANPPVDGPLIQGGDIECQVLTLAHGSVDIKDDSGGSTIRIGGQFASVVCTNVAPIIQNADGSVLAKNTISSRGSMVLMP